MASELYSFGPFVLDVSNRTLRRDAAVLPLTPKEFDTLRCLVENAGKVVSKEILISSVWPGVPLLSENNLAQHIAALSRKLGNDSEGHSFIRNLARQGYCLAVPVTLVAATVVPVPEPVRSPQAAAATRLPFFPRKHLFWSAGAVLLAIFAGVVYLRLRGDELRVTGFLALTNNGLPKEGPLLSDGHRLIFQEEINGERKVVSVPISGGDVSPLDIPFRIAALYDIASDGSALLLSSSDDAGSKMWSWPLAGGFPQVIPQHGREAGWAPDRATIAFGDNTSLILANSGGLRTTSVVSQYGRVRYPRWSPDGTRVSFTLLDPKHAVSSLWEADEQGKKWKRMALTAASGDDQANGIWTADGRYFVYEAGSFQRHDVWAIPGAGRSLASYLGAATRLTNGPLNWKWPTPAKGGRQIFALGESLRGELVREDPHTGIWRPFLGGIPAYEIDFSRNGKWVTYTRYPEHTIWKARVDGSDRVQLTSGTFDAHQPHWSPDGSRIAFIARKGEKPWRIMTLDLSSGVLAEPISEGDDQGVGTWSPDGRSLVFGDQLYGRNPAAVHLFNERTGRVSLMRGSEDLWSPRWSPDGAYISALRSNRSALLLTKCCSAQWKTILEGKGFDDPAWSPDSKYIFLMGIVGSPRLQLLRVSVPDGHVQQIAYISDFPLTNEQWFGLAPDGSALGLRSVRTQEIYSLECRLP